MTATPDKPFPQRLRAGGTSPSASVTVQVKELDDMQHPVKMFIPKTNPPWDAAESSCRLFPREDTASDIHSRVDGTSSDVSARELIVFAVGGASVCLGVAIWIFILIRRRRRRRNGNWNYGIASEPWV